MYGVREMLRKTSSAAVAVLFLVQTAISTFPANAQSVAHGQTGQGDDSESARLVDKIAVLEASARRASFAGLDVFLRDDYLGPSPVLVRATCYGQQATP